MNIAFFVSDFPVLSETFVLQQIGELLDRGHEITVITGRLNGGISNPFAGRIAVKIIRRSRHRLTLSTLSRGLRAVPRTNWRPALKGLASGYLAPFMDAVGSRSGLGSYDAIIAHFGPSGVRAMLLREAGLLCGPIATIFHGMDVTITDVVRRNLKRYRRLFRQTEMFLPVSRFFRNKLIGWGAPADRTFVHHMGTDVDDPPRVLLKQDKRPLKIFSVGRLVEKKGFEDSILAVSKLSSVDYAIVGEGPLEAKLKALAARSKDARIELVGKLPHEEVLVRLADADVFLLPSVTAADGDMEGVPVSLMEAMATGVTVISTEHSGIPELIEDGIEGLLVPEHDPDALADVLSRVQSGQVDLATMRAAAFEKVRRDFNNRKLGEELEGRIGEMALSYRARTENSRSCRLGRHRWSDWVGRFEPGEPGGAERVRSCARCNKVQSRLAH